MPRGGKRPGSGRPKGSKSASTLSKEAAREALREMVKASLEPMVTAQIANACGLKFLMVRGRDGKFKRVAKDAAEKLNPTEEIIEVWEKEPSAFAFKDLIDRTLDQAAKPKEELDVNATVTVKAYKWQD